MALQLRKYLPSSSAVYTTSFSLISTELTAVGPIAASCAHPKLAEVDFRRGHLVQLADLLSR